MGVQVGHRQRAQGIETLQRLLEAVTARPGSPTADLAAELGVTASRIRQLAKEVGLPRSWGSRGSRGSKGWRLYPPGWQLEAPATPVSGEPDPEVLGTQAEADEVLDPVEAPAVGPDPEVLGTQAEADEVLDPVTVLEETEAAIPSPILEVDVQLVERRWVPADEVLDQAEVLDHTVVVEPVVIDPRAEVSAELAAMRDRIFELEIALERTKAEAHARAAAANRRSAELEEALDELMRDRARAAAAEREIAAVRAVLDLLHLPSVDLPTHVALVVGELLGRRSA